MEVFTVFKASSSFRVSYFRNRGVTWLLLIVLSFSFAPSISSAQQPTATIKTLSGNVLVSGQAATVGTALRAGETIQTQAGASAVLELSDGSELHLGEKTQITVAELTQTATGARVSRMKLLWGRVRAFLSPQHQIEESSFNIETPNALIGVKFSEPDIEVSYSLEKAETVGIAHTVELLAKNLLTNEDVLVPVGSTVIITSTTTKVIAGILAIAESTGTGTTGTGSASTGSTGMGTGKKVALGVGAAVAAGGIVAVAISSGNGSSSDSSEGNNFTGVFKLEQLQDQTCNSSSGQYRCTVRTEDVLTLTQSGNSITGNGVGIGVVENCCTANATYPITGTVEGAIATLTFGGYDFGCDGTNCSYYDYNNVFTATATLLDNGNILRLGDTYDFIRQ
jgi:hypothetical protein